MKKALFLSHTVNPFNVLKLDSIYAEAKRLGWAVQSAEFGWKSSAGLARAFRARYGMTMSEWRARLRPTH